MSNTFHVVHRKIKGAEVTDKIASFIESNFAEMDLGLGWCFDAGQEEAFIEDAKGDKEIIAYIKALVKYCDQNGEDCIQLDFE